MKQLDDKEKPSRRAALSELTAMLSGEHGKKLGSIKRPGAPGKGAPPPAVHQADGLEGPGEPGDAGDDTDQGGFCPHCGAAKMRG